MTAGERWAAAELERLREARFTPTAWWRFVDASLRRAGETRGARSTLARQARAWSAAGLVGGLTLCGSRRLDTPGRPRFALWWLATAAMLDWHLGMVEGVSGEPRDRLAAADALTLLRIWSVPFLAAQRAPAPFAAAMIVAGASDALDGRLARRSGATRLGRDLDGAADALAALAAVRAARRAGWLPTGVARLVVVRSVAPPTAFAIGYFGGGARLSDGAFGPTRPLAPVLLIGLALASRLPRAAALVTTAASLGSLVTMARAFGDHRAGGARAWGTIMPG